MYQQPVIDENEAAAPSAMRGLLVAAPIALLLWVGVAGLARFLV